MKRLNFFLSILLTLAAGTAFAKDAPPRYSYSSPEDLHHAQQAGTLLEEGQRLIASGKYADAEADFRKALMMFETMKSPIDTDIAAASLALGVLYYEEAQYAKAEPYIVKAVQAYENKYGVSHERTMSALHDLALIYMDQGQYERAEKIQLQCLKYSEIKFGNNDAATVDNINNLANNYFHQGKYIKAIDLHKRTIKIIKRNGKTKASRCRLADSLNNLAGVYWEQGSSTKSGLLTEQALHMRERCYGPFHPAVAKSLNNLALYHKSAGHIARAEALHRRALRIFEAFLGTGHPETIDTMVDLAVVLAAQGRWSAAVQFAQRASELVESRLQRESLTLSDEEFASLLTSIYFQEVVVLTSLAQKLQEEGPARAALALALQRKGRLADAAASLSHAIHESLPPADRKRFEELRDLRSQLSSLALSGPGAMDVAAYHEQMEELERNANKIELELAVKSAPLRARRNQPSGEELLRRIATNIPRDTLLIEFIEVERYDFSLPEAKQLHKNIYLAFIVRSDGSIAAKDLGDAGPIDDAARRLHAALSTPGPPYARAADELYQRLIDPLLPEIGFARRLILSLDGQLHLVPFDVLARDGKELGGSFRISYVTSGRDLLAREAMTPLPQSVVVFADPDFMSPHTESGESKGPAIGVTNRRDRGLRPDALESLPGTRKEAEAIKALFPSARVFLGQEATESALVGLPTPAILHIATHGVFADDTASAMDSRAHSHFEEDSAPVPSHPLLRSALALAGAAAYQPALDSMAAGHSDGLVTAMELAGLNLWGTQLVVLSACNTGRGQIKLNQGVYGLRRAVLTAGAETLVTSLWKVNDDATQELMKEFYHRLKSGYWRADALHEAALVIKRRYPHPHYWASFILLGDGTALHGLAH